MDELKSKVAKVLKIAESEILSAREAEDGALHAVTAAGQEIRIAGKDIEVLVGPTSAKGDSEQPIIEEEALPGKAQAEDVIPLREDMRAREVSATPDGLHVDSVEAGADVFFQPTPDSQPQPAPGGVVLPDDAPGSERVVDSEGTPLVTTEEELEQGEESDERRAEQAEAEEALKDEARKDVERSKKKRSSGKSKK